MGPGVVWDFCGGIGREACFLAWNHGSASVPCRIFRKKIGYRRPHAMFRAEQIRKMV